MNIKNILIVKGATQYGVLNDFSTALSEGFSQIGINVNTYDDILGIDAPSNQVAIQKKYDLILSFNAIVLDRDQILCNNRNTLVWSFLVDHPYHLHHRLLAKCNNHIISCVDKNHVDYAKKYYSNLDNVFFLPHGGNLPSIPYVPYKSRKYNVCIMGTYKDIDYLETELSNFPEPDKTIVNSITSKLKSGSNTTIEELLDLELKLRNINLPKKMFLNLLNSLLAIDVYLRVFNRKIILDKLIEAGIQVDVFGNGWEKYHCENPELLHIHGNLPYEDILTIMSDSKIVINPLPLFRNGSHERVFTSMLCGAVCLSEINTYLCEEFNHGENIVFFDMSDLDSLVTNINILLENNVLADSISKNGYEKAYHSHQWKNRSRTIIDMTNSFLQGKESEKEHISICSQTDYEFNSIVEYIQSTNSGMLSNKLKAALHYQEITSPECFDLLLEKLIAKGLWPQSDLEGSIFCRNETRALKDNLPEYIALYETLDDEQSKTVLVNLLNYKLSFSSKYLKKIASQDITTTDLNIVKIYNHTDLATKSQELPPKLSLRYLGDYIFPENIILFAK